MPCTPFLSLSSPNPLTVKGAEVVRIHGVEPTGRFLVAGDVIGKGEREETAIFYPVEGAEPVHVFAQGKGGFLVVGGKLGGTLGGVSVEMLLFR